MRKMRINFCSLVMALLASSAAAGAIDEQLLSLYVAGDYDAVANQAEQSRRVEDFAVAARALNAKAYFEPARKKARRIAKTAQEFAEAALDEDPDNVEGRLQAAIAMAVRGSNMSPVSAFFKRLPGRSRNHIDHALGVEPDNAWALSTSAAWRLEVSRRGGGSFDGADPEQGYEEFLAARELDPGNVAIAYECALRLLASERAEWRGVALEALQVAIEGAPQSVFEQQLQQRAIELEAAVIHGPAAEEKFIEAQP